MLYTKPLEDLTFADVKTFVGEKRREGEILDYKQSWPQDLSKVMAAMANTYGGVILVGVSEEGRTGLPDQIVGVPVERGIDTLRQKVVSLAYQAIYPPVIPEVEAYEIADEPDYAVVVIRIAQSDRAPHAVDGRKKIYVRVDSQSQPHLYRLATIDEIEWLLNQRERGEEFLDGLVTAAKERSEEALSGKLMYWKDHKIPTFDAWVIPRFYSGEEFLLPVETRTLLDDRCVNTSIMYQSGWGFPFSNRRRSVPMGYCAYTDQSQHKSYNVYEYFELNTRGLLYTKTRMKETAMDAWKPVLPLDWVLCQLDGLLRYAGLCCEKGCVYGLLQVHASLSELGNVVLRENKGDSYRDLLEKHKSLDNVIDVLNTTIDVSNLDQSRPTLVKETARNLLWSFGYDWSDEAFEGWWKGAWKN